jgi:HPt (histidine-containing phosphotransfer) domain-containing protein
MNIPELKKYLNCDNKFLASIIHKFIEEVMEVTETMEAASHNKKWEAVRLNAHKMLSSVRIFELKEIVVILEKIEIDVEKHHNYDVIEQEVKKLSVLIKEVVDEMKITVKELY